MEEGLKEHQRNLSDLVLNHVIPKHAISGLDSSVGATLNSENRIIASCRIIYQQVSIYFRLEKMRDFLFPVLLRLYNMKGAFIII